MFYIFKHVWGIFKAILLLLLYTMDSIVNVQKFLTIITFDPLQVNGAIFFCRDPALYSLIILLCSGHSWHQPLGALSQLAQVELGRGVNFKS